MKFMFNGIKLEKTLIKGWFSFCHFRKTITFYADSYEHLPEAISSKFQIRNQTDSQTDYFDKDKFDLDQSNEMFNEACKVCVQKIEKTIRNIERRLLTSSGQRNENYYLNEIMGYRRNINEIKTFIK